MKNGDRTRPASGELAALLEPLVGTIDATVKAKLSEEPFQRDPRIVRRTLPLIEAVRLVLVKRGSTGAHQFFRRLTDQLLPHTHDGTSETNDNHVSMQVEGAAPVLEENGGFSLNI